jgi:ribosomal protein L11 methyltransferase
VIRLALRVDREHAERVLAELLELAPSGVEEVELDGGERIEYAVYGAPGELPSLPDLDAAAGGARVEISTSVLADDWRERWREFHRPVLVAPPRAAADVPALRVRPPWEPPAEAGGEQLCEIVVDPGQAFGTGAHASTRLCLELLLALCARDRARGALLDVGTGSGVLAIAASQLGFDPVLGLDVEGESIAAARDNAHANGVALQLRRCDLRTRPLPWLGPGERSPARLTVAANLLRPLLGELAGAIAQAPSQLIAGGLLRGETDAIASLFAARLGLREVERRESGEWAALWLAGE